MKYSPATCVTLIFAALLLPACQDKTKNNGQTSIDSTARITEPTTITLPATLLTDRLRTLGLTQTGDWRGIALGDSLGAVRASEKAAEADLFEEDAKHMGYGVELKNLASMDVQYFYQNRTITRIQADLYLNDRQSVTAYTTDLTAYFTARYGKPTVAADQTNWAGPRGETVSLKNVSKGKDYGLKVAIGSSTPG